MSYLISFFISEREANHIIKHKGFMIVHVRNTVRDKELSHHNSNKIYASNNVEILSTFVYIVSEGKNMKKYLHKRRLN